MSEPLFSIITVTDNNPSGLHLTGKSLLQQFDSPDIEWIIIDNASQDKSCDLIREWDRDFIRFVSKPVRNMSHAVNTGIDMATGRYLWFVPAGDCFSDIYVLRDVARELRMKPHTDLLYGDARDNGIIHKARDFESLMHRPIIPFQAMLYRRAALHDTRWSEDYIRSADYDFTLRFQEQAHHIHYMPRLLCDLDSSTHSAAHMAQKLKEQHGIRAQALMLPVWKNTYLYYLDMLRAKLRRTKN